MKWLVIAALLAASPAAAADCPQVLQTAAFKRAVASSCGYFVNDGWIEQQAEICARQLGPAAVDTHTKIGANTWAAVRARLGFPAACKDILRKMRSGFVAD